MAQKTLQSLDIFVGDTRFELVTPCVSMTYKVQSLHWAFQIVNDFSASMFSIFSILSNFLELEGHWRDISVTLALYDERI